MLILQASVLHQIKNLCTDFMYYEIKMSVKYTFVECSSK